MFITSWLSSMRSTLHRTLRRREGTSHGERAGLVERLEDRAMLSVNAIFNPLTQTLSVVSTANDSIGISSIGGNVSLTVNGLPTNSIGNVSASQVQNIKVSGGPGGETIDLSGVTTTAFTNLINVSVTGGNGPDTILGSQFNDRILSSDGDDSINGGAGDDTITGGNGQDTIQGLVGNDLITGDDGEDSVDGGDGDDTIDAGDGEDIVAGGIGNDSLTGGDGQDTITGDDGNDTLNGMFGNDVLAGNLGDDSVLGGAGGDTISGGDGNDTLTSNGGQDSVSGDAGADQLNGGSDNDTLAGGLDDDTVLGGTGNDFAAGDEGNDVLKGQGGNDTLNGNFGLDQLDGGSGNDALDGGLNVGNGTGTTAGLIVGTNVNISQFPGDQSEVTIAINPTNPNNLVAVSNQLNGTGLFFAISTNGGASWTTRIVANGSDGLINACCDPSVVFDNYGNLFLGYLSSSSLSRQAVIALSSDGGLTFTPLASFAASDQPTVVAGPNSVWMTYADQNGLVSAVGAPITGLGAIGAFIAPESIPSSNNSNFGDIAIGPGGQVVVTYQNNTGSQGAASIFVNVDPDGLGSAGFLGATQVTNTNVGGFDYLPAQPNRSIDSEANLAYDQSGGAHNGRLYMAYTDEIGNESNNFDIFVRYSDNNGTTWSSAVRVNDDAGINSQFLPRIAVDQVTGNVAVSWYDSRNDLGNGGPGDTNNTPNDDAQFWGTVSLDGGSTFLPNVQLSAGTFNANAANDPNDYGDYTGLAFYNNTFYPVWADNSNSLGNNPDGTLSAFDIFTTRVTLVTGNSGVQGLGDTLQGGSGNDTLASQNGADFLNGMSGNDSLSAGAGDDTLLGGGGNDSLSGGDDNDSLLGQGGDDSVGGDDGIDLLVWNPGDGHDSFDGGNAFDTIQVLTGSASDHVIIDHVGLQLRMTFAGGGFTSKSGENLFVNTGAGNDTITVKNLNGVSGVQKLTLSGGGGTDVINASAQAASYVAVIGDGGQGNDNLIGGGGNDFLFGNSGNDTLRGGAGNDTADGGTGLDKLQGDSGNDSLSGGDHPDRLFGGTGNDTLDGSAADDTLSGEDGADSLLGSDGNDRLLGQAGQDSLDGGDGNDLLSGGEADDLLIGNQGNDSAMGDAGDDSLLGGLGGDVLDGGIGNDTVDGEAGNDLINGSAGSDSLLGGFGSDSISGGSGKDTLDGGANDDVLHGQGGNDNILGGDGNDMLDGGQGDDTLQGQDGNDTLLGSLGADGLSGDNGNDVVNGGSGADTLFGGDGNDTLRGASGLDILFGNDGDDDLDGQGDAPDTLAGGQGVDILNDDGGTDVIDEMFTLVVPWADT